MRVLVTGASGFVGRQVVDALARRDHTVIATSRRAGKRKHCESVLWRAADLLRPSEVTELVNREQPEGLIHCAWDATPGKYWTSPGNLGWVAASLNLLTEFVRNGGRRAVIAGTSAEYSWKGTESLNEFRSEVAPDSLYGVCKNSLRQMVERWAPTVELSWAWGRVFCPFGTGEKNERLIPRLIHKLTNEAEIAFDSGQLIRDFLHVEDLGDAFAWLLESEVNGCVNLASGDDTSIRDIVIHLARHCGNTRVEFGAEPDPVGQPGRVVADVSRLRDEVGWVPSKSLQERLCETVDWWASVASEKSADFASETRVVENRTDRGKSKSRFRESA